MGVNLSRAFVDVLVHLGGLATGRICDMDLAAYDAVGIGVNATASAVVVTAGCATWRVSVSIALNTDDEGVADGVVALPGELWVARLD